METLKVARDVRGLVFEPLHGDGLADQRNVHVVLTEPGQVRGNHYHRIGTEVLVVLGPALVRFQEDGQLRDYAIADGELRRFVIPPGIAHAIQNLGSRPGLLIGFNTQDHDPGRPDTVPAILIAPSTSTPGSTD
jgi:UDP-2-acetamido-2,6-beta-L-arabino-hexul-4-ose reductase